jgi:hypothetical protein
MAAHLKNIVVAAKKDKHEHWRANVELVTT